MNRWLSPRLGVLLGSCLLVGSPVAGQELGFSMVMAESDHIEYPSPVGFNASALIELSPSILVKLGLNRVSDETTKMGTVCQVYSPRIECNPEMTDTSITLTGLRAGLMWVFWAGEHVRFGLSGGGSFNQVGVESTGVSGRAADFLKPGGGQLGVHGQVSLAVAPYPRVPFRVTGGFTSHWVNFDVCSGEDPPQYDPLCETGTFKEVEVGLSYYFAR